MIWMWDAVHGGLEPQPWHCNITRAQPYPNFQKSTPALHRHNSVRVHPYAHPQHIKVLKHFVYIQNGFGMQSTGVWSLNHDIATSLGLSPYPNFQKSTPALHRHNSGRVHPYAHSQHIKVLKHFVYIWYGCGMQSMVGWSLNHVITTSLGLSYTLIIQKSTPDLQRRYSVRVHPYAHSQHIKVLKLFIYICYGCGMQSKGVWSLNHDITTSLELAHTPIFQNWSPPGL